jgi:hypothetical protein
MAPSSTFLTSPMISRSSATALTPRDTPTRTGTNQPSKPGRPSHGTTYN